MQRSFCRSMLYHLLLLYTTIAIKTIAFFSTLHIAHIICIIKIYSLLRITPPSADLTRLTLTVDVV